MSLPLEPPTVATPGTCIIKQPPGWFCTREMGHMGPCAAVQSKTQCEQKHSHYYRYFGGVKVDFYRLCQAFGITDQAQAHALKKIMFAGKRPDEEKLKDIKEAIDSLERWVEIIKEDSAELVRMTS